MMQVAKNAKRALPLLLGLLSCGCAGPFSWDGGATAPPATATSMGGVPYQGAEIASSAAGTAPFGHSTPLSTAVQQTSPLGQAQLSSLAAPAAASGSRLVAALRKAGNAVLESVEIQPQVTPAEDPIRLDSRPAEPNLVSADLHFHAGRVFEARDSLQVAAGHYRDALMRNPNDVRLLSSYARVQDRLGNFSAAEAAYRRAMDLNPNDPSPCNDLAMCYARQQNWDGAMGMLNRAIRLEPSNPLFRNNLALVLVDSGRPQEAFQQLVAAHGEAIAHYNLGYMLFERRMQAEAEQHFAQALELNPRLAQAQQMLHYVQSSRPQLATAGKPLDLGQQSQLHQPGNSGLARLPHVTER